ncbi:MLO-like protein 12 [Apostasia shenzhenica]|uniref:MLO-like protein n=1 Tax=Apostasia shenzhenica TaxID=1088818 RepID=A0A2I0AFS9_9ASPA|nr:MLO-like protein 12 [Apostasia shenzhenica]
MQFVGKAKRKSLNEAIYQLKSGLRSFGFISLLLTMVNQPVSKLCISTNLTNTFLPCIDDQKSNPDAGSGRSRTEDIEEDTCPAGKVPLLSPRGTQHLQTLIFMLAIFHVTSSLFTLLLGEIKMKRWELWEKETQTLDHKLYKDTRRFQLVKETTFGKRHLTFWSNNSHLRLIVCFLRQFVGSVTKADYFALRKGFINAHFGSNVAYNFHKYLRRSLDKDFKDLVTISFPIWAYVVLFVLFSANGFYAYYWHSFIPLAVLLIIGAKLETTITNMCLRSTSKETVIITGEFSVEPNDELFWFGSPRWFLHAIQFILIENSFQVAFIVWDLYTFGLHSCLHRKTVNLVISLGVSLLVQFLSAYVTLPLYALVSQMGSSMKETVLTDKVVLGLKNWHDMAKRSLSSTNEAITAPSSPLARSSTSLVRKLAGNSSAPATNPKALASSSSRSHSNSLRGQSSTSSWLQTPTSGVSSSKSPQRAALVSSLGEAAGSLSSPRAPSSPEFEFPKLDWRELAEFQRVTEEMMGLSSKRGSVGELSFRMWWTQEVISSTGGGRSPGAQLHSSR